VYLKFIIFGTFGDRISDIKITIATWNWKKMIVYLQPPYCGMPELCPKALSSFDRIQPVKPGPIYNYAVVWNWEFRIIVQKMTQVVRRLLLLREVWGLNARPIKSPKRCQRFATAATLKCGPWRKAAEMGTAHSWRSKLLILINIGRRTTAGGRIIIIL